MPCRPGCHQLRRAAQDLHLGGRADGRQHRLGIGLDVVDIDRRARRRARPSGRCGPTRTPATSRCCSPGSPPWKAGPTSNSARSGEAARLVARRGLQQAGQQGGAHVAHLGRDRVGQHRRVVAAAEQRGRGLVDEAVGHAFVVAQRRRGAPRRSARASACGVRIGFGTPACGARHRLALQLGQRGDARHLLDQIGLALHVGAPAGHMRHVAVQPEAERGQRLRAARLGRDVHADQRLHPVGIEPVGARSVRHLARRRRPRTASPPHRSRIIARRMLQPVRV